MVRNAPSSTFLFCSQTGSNSLSYLGDSGLCPRGRRTRLSPSHSPLLPRRCQWEQLRSLVWLLLYFQSGGPAACHTQCLVKATCPVWGCRSVGLGCTQPPFLRALRGPSQCHLFLISSQMVFRPSGLGVGGGRQQASQMFPPLPLAQGWGQGGAGRKDIARGSIDPKEFIEKREPSGP